MQLIVNKTKIPTTEELYEVLKSEFSNKYEVEVKQFGIVAKGILIRKSAFVSVGIYVRKGKMNIFGRFGSL